MAHKPDWTPRRHFPPQGGQERRIGQRAPRRRGNTAGDYGHHSHLSGAPPSALHPGQLVSRIVNGPAGTVEEPAAFRAATEALRDAQHRPEISLGPIRAPSRLAPYSYALGAEIEGDPDSLSSAGEAFGRLILLYDPDGADVWQSVFRFVAYIQAELDDEIAVDPLLPEVAWSWLTEALASEDTDHTALGGTVTSVASLRYGDMAGPARSHQLEIRASWTPLGSQFAAHVEAFCSILEAASGLPPVGISELRPQHR